MDAHKEKDGDIYQFGPCHEKSVLVKSWLYMIYIAHGQKSIHIDIL